MTSEERKVLLLDLGGVVASLGDPVDAMGLTITRKEFWSCWLSSSLVRDLETGRMTTNKFLNEIARPLGEQPGDDFNKRFRAWRIEPFADIVAALDEWSQQFHLALLSNTNEIHWQGATDAVDLDAKFDKLFLSFETGHFKPAEAAYTQVMEHYSCAPREIYFLDDAEKNVRAARSLGLNAYQVSGATAVRDTVAMISTL